MLYTKMFVPSVDDWNRESWRVLFKECIDSIGKLKTQFFFAAFAEFNDLNFLSGLCEPVMSHVTHVTFVF